MISITISIISIIGITMILTTTIITIAMPTRSPGAIGSYAGSGALSERLGGVCPRHYRRPGFRK